MYRAIDEEKLKRGSCVDCGLAVTTKNFHVFHFDHRPGTDKLRGLCEMARWVPSITIQRFEMAKCDLRCANCHRIVTIDRMNPEESVKLVMENILVQVEQSTSTI
jgi:hypothetical protein